MDKFPVGVQSFSTIRENGMRYVDKTDFALRLLNRGRRFFLSRPRRFGKSLFVDTLQELFEGNEALFKGLAIHEHWNWSERYPVIRLDFGSGSFSKTGELERRLGDMLSLIEREASLPRHSITLEGRFVDLIRGLSERAGSPVVILVDEYDQPVLRALGHTEVAEDNRETLNSFYSVLKQEDGSIRFVFVTGVTMFSRVSLFSGANSLPDVSLDPEFSDICGYTDFDIDNVFTEDAAEFNRESIRNWYNGYSWRGDNRLYNPHSILLLLTTGRFDAWWYHSGTSKFLINFMKQQNFLPIDLESAVVTDSTMAAAEIDDVSIEALLFQTGYLTLAEDNCGRPANGSGGSTFRLRYPNHEVRQSLNSSIINSMLLLPTRKISKSKEDLAEIFQQGKIDELQDNLESVLAGIPHQWHTTSNVSNYEAYFASVVYAYFIGANLDVRVEDSTSEGRIDLAVIEAERIFLFEFKMINGRPLGKSLNQLRDKDYAKKYRRFGRPIHLVGVEFSKETSNVAVFDSEWT